MSEDRLKDSLESDALDPPAVAEIKNQVLELYNHLDQNFWNDVQLKPLKDLIKKHKKQNREVYRCLEILGFEKEQISFGLKQTEYGTSIEERVEDLIVKIRDFDMPTKEQKNFEDQEIKKEEIEREL